MFFLEKGGSRIGVYSGGLNFFLYRGGEGSAPLGPENPFEITEGGGPEELRDDVSNYSTTKQKGKSLFNIYFFMHRINMSETSNTSLLRFLIRIFSNITFW